MHAGAQFGGRGQKKDVRRTDTIDRRHECYRDAVADLLDVFQVLHHLNQPHHGPDDADGRRVAAGGVPDLGFRLGFVLGQRDVDLHHFAQFGQVRAVHRQAERFAQKGIGHGRGVGLEADNALLPCFGRELNHGGDHGRRIGASIEKYRAQAAKGADHGGHRGGDEYGSERASHHDHGGGSLRHILDAAFLQDQASDDSRHRQRDAGDGGQVGPQSGGFGRGRLFARLRFRCLGGRCC